MDDKQKYLEFWGYTLGTPEAEEAWKLKCEHTNRHAPMVAPDLPGYVSPVTEKWVEGRAARREDLKRSGCRPYEDGEREHAKKAQAENARKADQAAYEAAARAYYSLPYAKQRVLKGY